MFHRSERLLLRPAWPEDAQAVYSGIGEEAVVRNLARAPWPYMIENARDWVSLSLDPKTPSFLVTLPTQKGEEVIGSVGIGEREDGVELGYWIARKHWGKGYATEAARSMLKLARLIGYRKVSAGHYVDNPASGRVLMKAGFRPTGVVGKRFSLGRGEEAACKLYDIDLEDDVGPMTLPQAA
jgi:RimJ/RimL family protein N-acetyltransferase